MAEKTGFSQNADIKLLVEASGELFDLGAAASLLHWDQETYMPPKGILHRGRQLATLSAIFHQKLTDKKIGRLVNLLTRNVGKRPEKYTLADRALVREMKRAYDNATKIPEKLVKELAEASSIGLESWKKARQEKKFALFAPSLEKMVQLKIAEANKLGFKYEPYDALLDQYEPDLDARTVEKLFTPLRGEIVTLLKEITAAKVKFASPKLRGQHFDVQRSQKLTEKILEKIGYDFSAGRQDLSTHPFTINFGHQDVRVTNRFSPQDLASSIFTAIHEGGHALYELGVEENLAGSLLAGGTSLGIHESQSRFWENFVGRSEEFWEYLLPQLKVEFASQVKSLTPAEAYREVNRVKPDFIRVEADEVTYNLHIILRFEIERDLINGKIKVKDLPEIWNSKMKEFLGITPPNDALGVLQDIHWSQGSIGYFPTYTLGNLYAAQFNRKIQKDLPKFKELVSEGNFEPILLWLRKNIHHHGSVLRAKELAKQVTGEELNSRYFVEYLNNKYRTLYKLGAK